jgi:flagellar biosynthetic protein FliR
MGTDLTLTAGTLYGFLLELTRISGVFVFIPLPGIQASAAPARVALSLATTMALFHLWPATHPENTNSMLLLGQILSEATLGIAVGIAVAFLAEMFQMGAQIVGLQAGYTFASTIDPTTGADSAVLISMTQACAGLLFFAIGLDHQILAAFANSLITRPPGEFAANLPMARLLLQTGSSIFSTGLRLVLPLVALLIIVDISLALLARLNSQLQLLTLAFPVKMLLSLALLASLVMVFPKLYTQSSHEVMQLVRKLLLV